MGDISLSNLSEAKQAALNYLKNLEFSSDEATFNFMIIIFMRTCLLLLRY